MSISIEDVGGVEWRDLAAPERLPPLHPGEVLREEFLGPTGLSAYALAKALHVPLNRITAILAGNRAVSADTALRLGLFFGTTPEFWINLQGAYDLEVARVRVWESGIADKVRCSRRSWEQRISAPAEA